MTNSDWQEWFERIWAEREERLYPALFGSESVGIFPIPFERLAAVGCTDPRWSTCGVFRFSPTPQRPSWLYVSSGLSNAWFDEEPDPANVSGFGCEFVLEANEEHDWPIQRLHQLMAFQIALCCGLIAGREPLNYYDRIPSDSPIDWRGGELTTVMLAPPVALPHGFQQASGSAALLGVAAVTADEAAFGREHGASALMEKLIAAGAYPVIDPRRRSVLIDA